MNITSDVSNRYHDASYGKRVHYAPKTSGLASSSIKSGTFNSFSIRYFIPEGELDLLTTMTVGI